MKIPVVFRNNTKGYLAGLIFCLIQFYANGQACSCPPIGTCGPCQSGFTSLTFRYNGGLAIAVSASDASGSLYADLFVFNGETFTIEGSQANGKFSGQVTLSVNAFPHFIFETNCSFPFVIGDDYGSFTLMAAESFSGGPLCCQPDDHDNVAPTISGCPTNRVVTANASCLATVNWTAPTAADNCGGVTLTSTHSPGSTFPKGTTTVQYTATDDYGNTSTCSFNVTVTDNINPVIAGCPSNIVVSADASCQAVVNWTAPTVSDNCGGTVTLTSTKASGTAFSLGTTTVTYTATDAAGNISTCSFDVTVTDNINPVIAGCPSNLVVSADASCQAVVNWTAPTVSDNCGGTVTLTSTKASGTVFSLGTTAVTYTATDAAGNISTCSFNVTVQDNTNPVIAGCPSNIVVSADASCQAVVNWTVPTVTDNCGGTLSFTSTKNPGDIFSLGTTPVTYTATDAVGNTSVCSFNVVVQDNTNPVITGCPSNITVIADASCQAVVTWTAPSASDNCGGTPAFTSNKNPGDSFSVGTTSVIYTATDAAGNISTCSFNVTVQDNTNPVISGCPSDIILNADVSCQATASWTAPTVSDNCAGTVTLTSTKNPGDVFTLGTTPVTYTATDAAGNTSTCSFNVIVQDNTNPVIIGCSSNIVISANASCQAVVSWTAPTVSDNCGGTVTLTSTRNPGDTFSLGTTTVTYTATDAAGNTSQCSFNVTVQDNTNPIISGCPSDVIISANASCQAVVNWTVPTVSDNCGGTVTFTSTKNPGDVFSLGTTTVIYTATDAIGNTSSCSFDVIVQDDTNPLITGCPSNIVASADASCQATVNWTAPTVSDNCGGTVTLTSTKNPGDTFSLGTTTVTYTASDAAGNTSTCSFNVVVQDDTNPIISGCPSNIVVSADASCQAAVNWTAPTVTDNCGGAVTFTSTKNPGDIFSLGTTPVSYTATDAAGNISTCSFNVVVQDNTNPIISGCPSNIVVSADASCQAVVNWTAPTVTDNCGGAVTFTSTKNPGDIFSLGTTPVSYTATDAAGNTSTCSFNVVVQDNTNPIISGCPSDIVVSADASCLAAVNWTAPTVTDNCGGAVTFTSTKNPGDIFSLGTTAVTYTATDAVGNTSTCSFNVVVQDNTNPVITGCPSNIVLNADVTCQATATWAVPTVSDNCGGTVTLTSAKNPGDIFSLGTTTVTYTATDATGNISTCSFDVTVQDNANPVITGCPSNIVVSADASCQAVVNWTAPTVTDNCGGAVTFTSTKNPGDIFSLGTTAVSYTATDAAGNTSTCSFNIVVQDNTNPTISGCPSNIVVSADASCQAAVNWTAPTVTDNCGGAVTFTSTKNPGDIFSLGTTAVTYTATDAIGNTSTCSFNVIVQDDTNPLITGCPSNIVVSADASCEAPVNWTAPTVSDNCGGTVTLTSTKNPGDIFALGTTTVTYTATDAAGNTSICSFDVVVQDHTNPVINGCPSNIVIAANASCEAVVSWPEPTASDNCTGFTMASTKSPGDVFSLGTTTVTYTAEDAAGNQSTCSFDVVVQDNTDPVITGCPSNIIINADASCQAVVTWAAPTVSDNCAGVTFTSTKNSGDTFALGTTTVTYTATDATGNTAACSFDVVVQDNTNPTISGCPSDIILSADASCQATANWAAPTVTDNCSGTVSLTNTENSGDVFPIGTTTVTYTATDAAGNTSTCSFNVVVRDDTNPVISGCPADIVVNADTSCEAIVNWTAPVASDNCGGVTLVSVQQPGDVFQLGTTTVVYTATDVAGNTSTCSFNVVVEDHTNPVITGCPSNIVVGSNASCQATVNWAAPAVTDNCLGATLAATKNPGDIFPVGTTTVTYTATDAAGNTSTCSFDVVVQDNIDPVITGCPSNLIVAANASCQATVSWTSPAVSDNCLGATLTASKNSGDIFPLGTTVVIYTAIDAAGNRSTCSFNVVVEDNSNPVISSCPTDIVASANASCQAVVNWTAPTATDNCGSTVTLSSSKNPGDTFSLGRTIVTYTATDASGNTATCAFNVIVEDNSPPEFAACADIKVTAGASCATKVQWTSPAASDCGIVTVTSTHMSGDVFQVGTTEVTYNAVDDNGNTSSCKFNVIVEDKTAPVFENCPRDITFKVSNACDAVISWMAPTVSDNCGSVSVTKSHEPGSAFPIGKTTVKYSATDAAGNKTECEFDVTVKMDAPPSFTNCPENLDLTADESGTAIVDWTPPTATAGCGDVVLTATHSPGSVFSPGLTIVTYKAEDTFGNTAYCEFQVIVTPQEIDIEIARIVTPDGNRDNDELVITNIEKFVKNKIIIVDRWGSVVYSASGYNNGSIAWTGVNPHGAGVPTGTYFYTISVQYGNKIFEKTGFIELIR